MTIYLLGWGSVLLAQPNIIKINADTFQTSMDLYQKSLYFLDDRDLKKIDKVMAETFIPPPVSLKKVSGNAYWFKLEIKNEATDKTINALICSALNNDTDLFTISENQVTKQKGGQWTNYKERAFKENPNCFPIEIEAGQQKKYFIRIRSFFDHFDNTIALDLKTYKTEELHRHIYISKEWLNNSFYSSFLGILLFLTVFSSFLYFSTKEKAILFYGAYMLGNFLYYLRLWETRSHPTIIFTYFMEWYPNIEVTNGYFIFAMYMFFVKYFLDLPSNDPTINKTINLGIYGVFGMMAIDLFIQSVYGIALSYEIYKYIRIGFFIFAFYVCYAILFHLESKLGKYIIIGTCFLLTGTLFSLLTQLIPGTDITTPYSSVITTFETEKGMTLYMYNVKPAILLEILFFTLGLSHKSKLIVEEKHALELRNNLLQRFLDHQILSQMSIEHQESSPYAKEAAFIQKVNNLILQNLDNENFKSQELQQAVNLSRTQFFNKLKALTGYSPSNYMNFIRLEKARELLENTDLTIAEIAYKVGFGDPNYFSRKFAETFGHPPSQFRK